MQKRTLAKLATWHVLVLNKKFAKKKKKKEFLQQ